MFCRGLQRDTETQRDQLRRAVHPDCAARHRINQTRQVMKLIIRTLVLAGSALALPVVPALAAMAINGSIAGGISSDVTHVAGKFECFTDDGYGRKFPCSAQYKRDNPNWRSTYDCFTDEGNGRYRPCDSFFSRAKTKN
jgi:hypothetical protein